jgi:hypothetical protein
MGDNDGSSTWEHHEHDAIVHRHEHPHVTHNLNERTQGFDHLSSSHEHDHDHAAVSHAHYGHIDFESEHRGEAHDHDHGEAVKQRSPARSGAAKRSTRPRGDASGEQRAAAGM